MLHEQETSLDTTDALKKWVLDLNGLGAPKPPVVATIRAGEPYLAEVDWDKNLSPDVIALSDKILSLSEMATNAGDTRARLRVYQKERKVRLKESLLKLENTLSKELPTSMIPSLFS